MSGECDVCGRTGCVESQHDAGRPAPPPVEPDDPVEAEITRLNAQITALQDRVRGLRQLRSHPHVTPVQVYWRYHREYREEYSWDDAWNLLEKAYRSLESMADYGECSPVGVEVGGFLYEHDELRERFGDI